jgi:uncharacterized protein with NRDE domain
MSDVSKRFPLILVHSRDEDISRPTGDLVLDDSGIFGARDGTSGGVAAVGMNVKTGQYCLLTNSRVNLPDSTTDGISRGLLVTRMLTDRVGTLAGLEKNPHEYNGLFHVITGSFLTPTRKTYFTNTTECPKPEIWTGGCICNEHPISRADWSMKHRYLMTIQPLPGEDADFEEIIHVISEGISITSIPDYPSTLITPLSWSPFPQAVEAHLLSSITVPAIKIREGYTFGTVSQTIMVLEVNGEDRTVHHLYRTVSHLGKDRVQFSEWQRNQFTDMFQ